MDLKNRNHLSLLLAFHAHQPVENFDHVFQAAFESSYSPFVNVLEEFPEIKISLHISGSLLDWLLSNKPQFIHVLRKMVSQGQIELLSAGYYEPILVLLPEWDRIGQINLHRSKMNAIFGYQPQGLWLTERVWEPSLPVSLRKAGIKFTIVDDEHFRIAGYNPEDLWGYYLTEEQGKEVAIFPGSKFLRYSLPFKLPEETIQYLQTKFHEGKNCITFGDDLEKFGFWPQTYEWVYEKKWLHNFFQALVDNKDWVKTVHFQDILTSHQPTSRVYLPCASYSEMMEWSQNMFRNFLVKYSESNHLHKRVFMVSNIINQLQDKNKKVEEARLHLYKAQNNDVYWHGVFGGLYLTNLRYNAYRHLIMAEKITDEVKEQSFPRYQVRDFDFDGQEEVLFKHQDINVVIHPCCGGTVSEIDYKPKAINIVNVLTRRPEKYHQKIISKQKVACGSNTGENPASIHDIDVIKEEGLENLLIYDNYRKVAWIDHLFVQFPQEQDLITNNLKEELVLWNVCYDYSVIKNTVTMNYKNSAIEINKLLEVEKNILNFKYKINPKNYKGKWLCSEFNLLFYSQQLLDWRQIQQQQEMEIEDQWFGVRYKFQFLPPAFVFCHPVYTVSDSEAGIEKTYQGMSLYFIWELNDDGKNCIKLILE